MTDSILKQQVKQLIADLDKTDRKATKSCTRTEEIAELVKGDLLDKAKKDCNAIHTMYRAQHIRMCALTEVCVLMRQRRYPALRQHKIMQTIIRCMDFPDSWWLARDHVSLGNLLEEFEGLKLKRAAA